MFIKKKTNKNKVNVQLKKTYLIPETWHNDGRRWDRGGPSLLIPSPFLEGKINEQLYLTLFSTYNLEITDNLWKYAFIFQLPEFLSKLSLKTHRKSALNNYCEIMSLCCPDEGRRFYGQTLISQHTLAGSIIMLMICIISLYLF